MKYIIVGAGVAGVSAIKEIKKCCDRSDEIVVFTEESRGFYYRPRLPECLSGEIDIKDILISDIAWFEKSGIDLHLEEKVVDIFPSKNMLVSEEDSYNYDRLLLAAGATPRLPQSLPGIGLPGVYTLRSAEDAEQISKAADRSAKAVVVGGGLLGLECAYNLQKKDLKVTVVEKKEYILNRQLDRRGGFLLQKELKDLGIELCTGCTVTAVKGEDSVSGVALKNGENISADFVLFAVGVSSNTEIAAGRNIEINKGIVVDSRMSTSAENVYAAGDAAEYSGKIFGVWGPSLEMGKVAGKNMVGKEAEFTSTVFAHSLKVADKKVLSLGITDENNGITSEVRSEKDPYCRVFKNREEDPVGAVIVGDYEEEDELVDCIKSSR